MNRPGRYRTDNLSDMRRGPVGGAIQLQLNGHTRGGVAGRAHSTAVGAMDIGGKKENW